MKITALVENRSDGEMEAKHGLSLYIETEKHKILFDLGPDNTLFENADRRGIDLAAVDTVIISHGHVDHGGALKRFLKINNKARIFVQRKAFERHYSKFLFLKVPVGLDAALQTHPQIVLLDGDYKIDDELQLFTVADTGKYHSPMNDALYTDNSHDNFSHEQNLMIFGEQNVLIMGCGHAGVVNILERAARYNPQVCIGGYHLMNPLTKQTVPDDLLDGIASELSKHNILYYTCHCTGERAFNYLSKRVANLNYLSCGATVEV